MSKYILHYQIDEVTGECTSVSWLASEVIAPNMIVEKDIKDLTAAEIEDSKTKLGKIYDKTKPDKKDRWSK